MPDDVTWGERLKARRLELDKSPDDLAAAIGKHRSMIFRYENEQVEPSLDVMAKLADALDMDPCRLFFADTCHGTAA